MYWGGYAHNLASQVASGVPIKDLDREQARQSGILFATLSAPGMVNAAVSAYRQAPREAISAARNLPAKVSDIRTEALKLEKIGAEGVINNVNPNKNLPVLIASSTLNKWTDIKAIDKAFGENPEAGLKMINESNMPDGAKNEMIEKVEESRLFVEQQENEQIKDAVTEIERPDGDPVLSLNKDGKFTVTQKTVGEEAMVKEFDTREQAERFLDNFKALTEGERTFEQQKKITEKKVAAGEAKKPTPKAAKAEPAIAEEIKKDVVLTEKPKPDAVQERKAAPVDVEKPPPPSKGVGEEIEEPKEQPPQKEVLEPPAKPPKPPVKEPPAGAEPLDDGPVGETGEGKIPIDISTSKWNKLMKARGAIPKPIFQLWLRAKGRVNAKVYEIEQTQKRFKRSLKKAYGKSKIGPELMEEMNEALSKIGTGTEAGDVLQHLPEPVRESLIDMRDQVDALSREMVRAGIVEGDLAIKFDENLGFYLTRTYKAHRDKNWTWEKVPDEIKNRAISYVQGESGLTKEQAEASLHAWMFDAGGPIGMIKKGKLGSKDLSNLIARKNIPVELRELLGEYKDPLHNYATSVYKMTDLIARDKFLNDVLKMGEGIFLFDEPKGKFIAQLAAKESATMEPLNGKYTTPELKEAFEKFNQAEGMTMLGRWYMTVNSAVKYGKTIMSPQTHVRNYVANPLFHLANGRFYTGKGSARDLVKFNYQNSKDPEYREYISRLIELGVLRDNARAGEIFDVIQDTHREFNDMEVSLEKWGKKPVKKSLQTLTKLYQIEDDVHKLYAFGVERARYEEVIKKRNPKATPEEIAELADLAAAEIVRNTMPTYSLVPEAIKKIRRIPIVGTFVSFPAEVIRTSWNTLELIDKELKDPVTRKIGATRMFGFMSAALITAAAAAASRNLLGIGNKDDKDLKRFMPSWSKYSDILFIREPKDGVYTYVDMGYSDPFNYIKKGLSAFLYNKENIGEAGLEMAKELVEPFLGEELLASKLVDIKRNATAESGRPIYNPEDAMGDRVVDQLVYLWKGVQPGVVTSAQRISKGAQKKVVGSREYSLKEEIMAVGLGQRVAKINVGEAFMFKTFGYDNRLRDANRIYTSVLYSSSPDITQKDLDKAYEKANKATQRIIKEAQADYKAAANLGVPAMTLRTHLLNMRASQGVKNMIRFDRYMPLKRQKVREAVKAGKAKKTKEQKD